MRVRANLLWIPLFLTSLPCLARASDVRTSLVGPDARGCYVLTYTVTAWQRVPNDPNSPSDETLHDFHVFSTRRIRGTPQDSDRNGKIWKKNRTNERSPLDRSRGYWVHWLNTADDPIRPGESREFQITFCDPRGRAAVERDLAPAHWFTTKSPAVRISIAEPWIKELADIEDTSAPDGGRGYNEGRPGNGRGGTQVYSISTFRPRTPVGPAAVPGYDDFQPTLVADERELFWSSDRPGGSGGMDVWTSVRSSRNLPFANATNVTALNSTSDDSYAAVSSDGTELYLASDRPGGLGGFDLFVSYRSGPSGTWSPPVLVTELASTGDDIDPTLTADGLEIFFTSDRAGSLGWALWHARRPSVGAPWSLPSRLVDLDTADLEHSPAISADGLTLYYSSTARGASDFYLVERIDRASPFLFPLHLADVNTPEWDFNGTLANDGFAFYYSSYAPGSTTADIFLARQFLPATIVPAPVRVGQPWSLIVHRDPGDLAGLVLGTGEIAELHLPPFDGGISLQPPYLVVATGVCATHGRFEAMFPALSPTFVGLELTFQSYALDPQGELYFGDPVVVDLRP